LEAQPAFVEYFVSLMRVRSSIAAEYNPALLAVGLQPVEVCLAGEEIQAPVRIEFSTQLCTRTIFHLADALALWTIHHWFGKVNARQEVMFQG
jgi:hypothetical protein